MKNIGAVTITTPGDRQIVVTRLCDAPPLRMTLGKDRIYGDCISGYYNRFFAAIAASSGVGKLRRNPQIVHVVNEVVGVPLQYFPLLAACEIAGAVGLVLGIWFPLLGETAGIGLVVYFVGAIVSHVRVGDVKGIGPATFMLIISAAALILRLLVHKAGIAGDHRLKATCTSYL